MARWIASALGASTLLAAGLVIAPWGVRAEKAEKAEKADKADKAERRVEVVRLGGGRLGVRLGEVDKDDVARLKLPDERGALVRSVEEGSAAEKAGIKEGDVILRYQGEAVSSAAQLARLVRETPSGRTVALEVSRGGAAQKLTATLGEGSDRVRVFDHDFEVPVPPVPPVPPMAHVTPPEMPELPEAFHNFHWNEDGDGRHPFFRGMSAGPLKLGVRYQEISGQLAQYFKLGDEKGLLVVSVEKDAPAGKAGIKAGDVILKFDGKPVKDGDDLRDEVRRAEGGKEVTVTVQRDGRPLDLKVQLAKPEEPRRAGGVSL
jgi:C-terminal processing protease CtpA/Prc